MTSDERRLIESISFISDRAGTTIGHAAKLLDYDDQSIPIEQVRGDIEEMRELLDEIEDQLDSMEASR